VPNNIRCFADCERVSEQLLAEEVEKRFPKCPVVLSPVHVEQICRGSRLADLYVALLDVLLVCICFDIHCTLVRIHQLQCAFNATRRVFRPLSVLAVRQVDN